jgi:hypothetical protein
MDRWVVIEWAAKVGCGVAAVWLLIIAIKVFANAY